MAEVRVAAATHHFGAVHAVRVVCFITNTYGRDGLEETGPAATTGKFGIGTEKRVAANGTIIRAFSICIPVFAFESPFGPFLPGYVVNISR